uniref:PNPLA domain-containing protein n=1 Tax=Chromera velia CCMP2878 TaxID=1169474 RepID=A0A0G4HQ20_9ALVE|eukprot:Cvel_1234.t1-p1 / transcript=Cvel_1234.t1 / gene=Cvel_1234 / organism=Chromera_velia_CCMP2878 / gene_product=Patatin-like phospholipase domain-containing, putative / transcript_product=Patatin-like phospholipase domain-containing, putative / location=Cvel_scaffold41:67889-70188(+) / protein_length=526 / sequence_SO=supercontig / SO=protein_coding / is_pseudo=false
MLRASAGALQMLLQVFLQVLESVLFNVCVAVGLANREPEPVCVEEKETDGEAALCLSGGAMLGSLHLGVLRSLHDEGLLPRIVSGSSVGSLMGAVLGTRTDEELDTELCPETLYRCSQAGGLFPEDLPSRAYNIMTRGHMLDEKRFLKGLSDFYGEITFKQAFERTGRVLNVSVARHDIREGEEQGMLLNHQTAPNVTVASAVAASCSFPLLYPPRELVELPPDGTPKTPQYTDRLFTDGSLIADVPVEALRSQFGVKRVVVSQVNPHILPFLFFSGDLSESLGRSGAVNAFFSLGRLVLGVLKRLAWFLPDLARPVTLLRQMATQKYRGTVTLLPQCSGVLPLVKILSKAVSPPSMEEIEWFFAKGKEQAASNLQAAREILEPVASRSPSTRETDSLCSSPGVPTEEDRTTAVLSKHLDLNSSSSEGSRASRASESTCSCASTDSDSDGISSSTSSSSSSALSSSSSECSLSDLKDGTQVQEAGLRGQQKKGSGGAERGTRGGSEVVGTEERKTSLAAAAVLLGC